MKNTSEITRSVLQRRDEWQQARAARRRVLSRTVVMVLVVLILCGGAAAAGSGRLTAFFEDFADLTPEQEVVAVLAEEFEPRTAVSGDWTITIDNAISDGWNYYLTLSVTGPEGWMEGIGGCSWYTAELSAQGRVCKWPTKRCWHELDLASADTDYYVMCLTLAESLEGPVTLELRDMILLPRDTQEFLRIGEESWVFEDLEFAAAGAPVELLAEPVTVSTWDEEAEVSWNARVDSVQLWTFGLYASYTNMERPEVPTPECQLVLKDGSTYEVRFSGGGDGVSGTMDAVFGFPVVLEEVDYILLDGNRLEIP